jgi:NitT/TauT family transport system substrate-binding protein
MAYLKRIALLTACVLAFSTSTNAQNLERSHVTVGAGGSPFYYLPLLIGNQLGFFKEQGLTLTINDFGGGSKALQALVGGSVDVVPGAYEHAIRMQVKGQDIRSVIELGRLPGIALAVGKHKADTYKSVADLKGMKIGVTAPGSSTHFLVMYLMSKSGIDPKSASYISVGASGAAIAAVKNGEIDAISNLDPVLTRLELDKEIKIVADTRTVDGTKQIFGATNPACVLLIKNAYIKSNPRTVQALVNGFYKTLKWMETATTEQIVAKMPEKYRLGDMQFTVTALANNRQTYSTTGEIPSDGMKSVFDMLAAFDAEVRDSKLDLTQTFDASFIKKAKGGQ